ncbi:S-adenosyl-L-methionine-dependent methyltransferase [Trametopsis cervina]|nr:S-adenosyl-L-methionine-dependent methyltransferase [Trametopsis cervina]
MVDRQDETHDYVAANEVYFDAEVLHGDDRPNKVQLARRVVHGIRKTYPELLDEDNTEVMDFACGTGILSRELCLYVRSIVGVDISQNAIDVYNRRVDQQGIPREEMRAIRTRLTGADGELGDAKFDIIVCAASYHHFPDINETTHVLSKFLKPGGSLLIADILKESVSEDSSPPLLDQYRHIVVHPDGFTEDEMRATIEHASLKNFDFNVVAKAILHGRDVKFFLARGVKS